MLYISQKLSLREAKYSTVEKKCLAIRWAVGSLRYYLLGRPFTLCSDHASIQWLHRQNPREPPTLCKECHGITVSQDLGLRSHPKDSTGALGGKTAHYWPTNIISSSN